MADDHHDRTNPTPEPAYQFGLRTLLVLPLLVVVFFALTATVGGFLAVLLIIPIVLIAACLHPRMRKGAVRLLSAYFVLGLFGALLLPTNRHPPDATRRSQCSNNLRQLGLALHNYHDRYGSFPPAYITDGEGHPIHSWRVLILPFLEQQPLYDRYRFDEPWNGPNNIKLVEEMPSAFQCPSNRSEEKTYTTNYVVVIGPQTAWPGERPVRLSDMIDGTSNTWLVVEVADSGIAWSEPRDLHALQMTLQINAPAGQGISSKHPGGAQVVYGDGSVCFVGDATSPRSPFDSKEVHDVLTINGGEPVVPGR